MDFFVSIELFHAIWIFDKHLLILCMGMYKLDAIMHISIMHKSVYMCVFAHNYLYVWLHIFVYSCPSVNVCMILHVHIVNWSMNIISKISMPFYSLLSTLLLISYLNAQKSAFYAYGYIINELYMYIYRQLRARRALTLFKDMLRTRRALSQLTLYSHSALLVLNGTSFNIINALLVLNGTSFNIINALLALNWRYATYYWICCNNTVSFSLT